MIFQNYALYPHMYARSTTWRSRSSCGARQARDRPARPRRRARARPARTCSRKKPRTLSGGQRQRVAMGRAIVREPRAFLMDEPLSNLDAKLRVQMRAEIARIQRDLSVTTIYVTHDQTRGDDARRPRRRDARRACCSSSTRRRASTDGPVNLFVAEFIGSPAMNLVEAEIDGGKVARSASTRSPVDGRRRALRLRGTQGRARDPARGPGGRRALRRPGRQPAAGHGRHAGGHGRGDLPPLLGRRAARRDRGRQGGGRGRGRRRAARAAGRARAGTPFVARVGRESGAREGDRIEVAVDTRLLHFFDLETGSAIARA